jgi:predicted CopG family antitoxin
MQGKSLVRVISISDEVYFELSRMKDGKSFTQLLKSMIDRCENKGDPKAILEFLNSHAPLSDKDAQEMLAEVEKGRKRNMSFCVE